MIPDNLTKSDFMLVPSPEYRDLLDEYEAWAEERRLGGLDHSVPAFREHQKARRPLDALREIAELTTPGDLGGIEDRIHRIATEALKETAA